MVKFINLVKNEYIKTFARISTWILIIFILLTSVGYTCLSKVTQLEKDDRIQASAERLADFESEYTRKIEKLTKDQPSQYEIDVEMYQFLIQHKIQNTDWRDAPVNELYNQKKAMDETQSANSAIDNKLDLLADNNWKDFYTLQLKEMQTDPSLTAEQREASTFRYSYALEHDLPPDRASWENELVDSITVSKEKLASLATDDSPEAEENRKIEQNEILIAQYRLEHGLEVVTENVTLASDFTRNFWTTLTTSSAMINVICLAIVIIAGASIANEFSFGTIKYLLINPVKRWKIFLSKYTMIITLSILLVLVFYAANILCSGLLFGFESIGAPYLQVVNGTVTTTPGLLFVLWKYLIGSVNLVVIGTLAFAISSLLQSSAIAIGVSVFAMLGGSAVVSFVGDFMKLDWARYIIFAHTDLNAILDRTTLFEGVTLGFSLTVIAVYMVVFLLTAWDGFIRRESI